MFPERFSNKTNGVTPRRWLLQANPALAREITQAIGERWITDLSQLKELGRFAEDRSFREVFLRARSARPKCNSPIGSNRRRGRSSTRTRSSIARSSASTNIRGNY